MLSLLRQDDKYDFLMLIQELHVTYKTEPVGLNCLDAVWFKWLLSND